MAVPRARWQHIQRAFLLLLCWCPSLFAAADNCAAPASLEEVVVAKIHDGDTLNLRDGRRIRILGINAPELGRDGGADQPYARDAMRAVETFFAGGRQAYLQFDRELQDTYERYLAHVYRRDGANLERYLLVRGLAYQVVIPPNLTLADCLAHAERDAKAARKGVWRLHPVAATQVRTGGFQRVLGKVASVEFDDIWRIRFEGGFSAVIKPQDQANFVRITVAAWLGQQLEVRGWVYPLRGRGRESGAGLLPWQLRLYTPAAVEVREAE